MRIPYLDRLVRFAASLLWTIGLLALLGLAALGLRQNPAWASKLGNDLGPIIRQSLPVTGAALGKALLLALLPAALLGGAAGWRRGSLADRLLTLPVLLLAGLPVVPVTLVSIMIAMNNGWSVLWPTGQWVLTLLLFPWLALAVRDGVAGARVDGLLTWHRTIAAAGGRLLQAAGPVLALTVALESQFGLRGGLMTLWLPGHRDLRAMMVAVAITAGVALLAHLAGDLLVSSTHREPLPPSRPCPLWLSVGGLLTLLLVAAAFVGLNGPGPEHIDIIQRLQPPGPDHWLGTDHLGRDVAAQLGAGLRRSLGWAAAAAGLALVPAAVLGAIGRATGPIGQAIATPRVPSPSLLGVLLWGYAAYHFGMRNPWVYTVLLAAAAVPALAHAFRRTLAAEPGQRRRLALTLLPGTFLTAISQGLLGEMLFAALGTEGRVGGIGWVLISFVSFMKRAPHLIGPSVAVAAGFAGLFLLGYALRDAADTEAGGS